MAFHIRRQPSSNPRTMRMSASIRYTTTSDWVIVKGRNVRQYGFDQYNELAQVLVGLVDVWIRISAGDRFIARCARGEAGPGNATTWRKVGTNHHLTLVAQQAAATPIPAAKTDGGRLRTGRPASVSQRAGTRSPAAVSFVHGDRPHAGPVRQEFISPEQRSHSNAIQLGIARPRSNLHEMQAPPRYGRTPDAPPIRNESSGLLAVFLRSDQRDKI